MPALFDRDRHEPLADIAWDEGAARAAIARIVEDTRARFTPDGMWPLHPNDADGGSTAPEMSLYLGAAGVIWTLDFLAREGAIDDGPAFAEHLPEIQRRNRAPLESPAWREALGPAWQTRSWLVGDAGILFTRWKTAPSPALPGVLAELEAVIAANTDDPARELMWGAPGTMLAALALHRATGEARWAELYRASAGALLAALHDEDGVEVWTQELYGSHVEYLGAVHGFAGNAFALREGRALLEDATWAALAPRLARTLEATAVRDGALVNWPTLAGAPRGGKLLVQHCHGAPGIVTAVAGLDAASDALLVGAGELIWTAGPLAKGANLCHGTAGNAHAFLALFARTGDARWLARARAFAMHAIAQSDAEATRLGQRRYSLWTGDLGLACFLWECVRGTARFPTMHVL